jgi:hypothetical protein
MSLACFTEGERRVVGMMNLDCFSEDDRRAVEKSVIDRLNADDMRRWTMPYISCIQCINFSSSTGLTIFPLGATARYRPISGQGPSEYNEVQRSLTY